MITTDNRFIKAGPVSTTPVWERGIGEPESFISPCRTITITPAMRERDAAERREREARPKDWVLVRTPPGTHKPLPKAPEQPAARHRQKYKPKSKSGSPKLVCACGAAMDWRGRSKMCLKCWLDSARKPVRHCKACPEVIERGNKSGFCRKHRCTQCPRGHDLTVDGSLYTRSDGSATCRKCKGIANRESKLRRMARVTELAVAA